MTRRIILGFLAVSSLLAVLFFVRRPFGYESIALACYAIACAAVFRVRNPEIQFQFVLASIAIAVSLMIGEATLRLGERDPMIPVDSGREFDRRSRLDVVQAMRRDGREVFPVISPSFFYDRNGLDVGGEALMPLSSVSASTTVFCNELGKYIIFKSDEHGFNNDAPAFSAAADVVLVGDSFTQGACVERNDNIASVISRRAKRKVVNLGVGGSGPLAHLAILAEYAAVLRPKVVVWVYFEGNDLGDLAREPPRAWQATLTATGAGWRGGRTNSTRRWASG